MNTETNGNWVVPALCTYASRFDKDDQGEPIQREYPPVNLDHVQTFKKDMSKAKGITYLRYTIKFTFPASASEEISWLFDDKDARDEVYLELIKEHVWRV